MKPRSLTALGQRPARAKSGASLASGPRARADSGSRLNHSFIGVPVKALVQVVRVVAAFLLAGRSLRNSPAIAPARSCKGADVGTCDKQRPRRTGHDPVGARRENPGHVLGGRPMRADAGGQEQCLRAGQVELRLDAGRPDRGSNRAGSRSSPSSWGLPRACRTWRWAPERVPWGRLRRGPPLRATRQRAGFSHCSFLAVSGPVMRRSSGNVAAMTPRASTIPAEVMT